MKDSNRKSYQARDVVKWYEQLRDMTPVERIVFERKMPGLASAALLDIGIGGGRTTRYLLSRCRHYTGIDYSSAFADLVKNNYPGADIRFMDARSMEAFGNEAFDVVNFSFNGIDYVGPEDRLLIFKEIRRVLKPGGSFFFSTHNKSHGNFNLQPWTLKGLNSFVKLKTWLKLAPWRLRHRLQKAHEVYTDDYAVINDSAHNYSLMTFYTTPAFLMEQLVGQGFRDIMFYTKEGKPESAAQLDEWIFVTCKKSA